MKTDDLTLLFHNAKGNQKRTREICEKYCTPIDNPPDVDDLDWLGYFKPERGNPVYICNDMGRIIAMSESDYQAFCNE